MSGEEIEVKNLPDEDITFTELAAKMPVGINNVTFVYGMHDLDLSFFNKKVIKTLNELV